MIQLSKINFKSKIISIFLLTSQLGFSQNLIKGYGVVSEKAPQELKLLVSHLVTQKLTQQQSDKVILYSKLINQDLKFVGKSNVLFMLKSEIYRSILQGQYLPKNNSVQVTNELLLSIEQKQTKFNAIYSDFSKWIISSVIIDFSDYRKDNFLNNYQSVDRTNIEELKRAEVLKNIIKYSTPWLELIEKLSPEQFNELGTKIAIDALRHISSKSYYFKEFSNKFNKSKADPIFKVATQALSSAKLQDNSPISLEEEKNKAKLKANEITKGIIPDDDLSAASEAIDKLQNLKNLKEQWEPK